MHKMPTNKLSVYDSGTYKCTQYLPFFSTKYIKIKTILIFSTIQKTKSNTYV